MAPGGGNLDRRGNGCDFVNTFKPEKKAYQFAVVAPGGGNLDRRRNGRDPPQKVILLL